MLDIPVCGWYHSQVKKVASGLPPAHLADQIVIPGYCFFLQRKIVCLVRLLTGSRFFIRKNCLFICLEVYSDSKQQQIQGTGNQ